MFFQDMGGPQTGGEFTTTAINQQNNQLLGAPPIQQAAMPQFNPDMLNSSTLQANPNVANMIKALKGDQNG